MTTTRGIGQVCAAVGIPQGLVVDPATGETSGAVRRGGDLVSIAPADYEVWLALATPRSSHGLREVEALEGWADVEDQIQRLRAECLVVDFDVSEALTEETRDLRPIPRGLGKGNVGDDSDVFRIQGHDPASRPLDVDPVTVMLWWEFDGLTSLEVAADKVALRLPSVRSDDLGRLAVALTLSLLAQRLIHLDCPASAARP